MMQYIIDFLRKLGDLLSLLWPPTAIRIWCRGAEEAAKFRAEHGREPTDEEWAEISERVDKEVTGR